MIRFSPSCVTVMMAWPLGDPLFWIAATSTPLAAISWRMASSSVFMAPIWILVGALAAKHSPVIKHGERLAGLREMRHGIKVVDVYGPKVENGHCLVCPELRTARL